MLITNDTKMRPHNGIEFADFGVFKALQFSKFNIRRDFIFEMETLISTHQIREVGDNLSRL